MSRSPAASRAAAVAEWKKTLDRWIGVPAQILLHGLDAIRGPWQRSHEVAEIRRIVLLKLWGLGNLAMILPYVQPLRRAFPGAEIVFLTLERNRPLVERHPGIDRVLSLDERGGWRPLLGFLRLVIALRRRRADLFLDFEQFLRLPGLLAWLGGAHQAIGFDTPGQSRARLHQARVPYDDGRHMAAVFGDIVRAAGVECDEAPSLCVPRRREALPFDVAEVLANPRSPRVLLHPGSGDNFPGRRWPVDRFAAVGVSLVRRWNARLLLSGTTEERPLLESLSAELARQGVSALDLGGRVDLPAWIECVAHVDLVVSNDTGPVHVAGGSADPVGGDLRSQYSARVRAAGRALPRDPPRAAVQSVSDQSRWQDQHLSTADVRALGHAPRGSDSGARVVVRIRISATRGVGSGSGTTAGRMMGIRHDLGLARAMWGDGSGGPSRVTALVTERCHLRCQFCRLWERPNSGVAVTEWLRFFSANPQLRWLNLSGGEIFAKEDLDTLLLGAVERLPRLGLLDFPTAGQRPERCREAVQLLLDSKLPRLVVSVSIDGGRALHDELRGIPGAFERAVETWRTLRALRTRRFDVRVGCTLTERAKEQQHTLLTELAEHDPKFDAARDVHYNLAHHSTHYYRNTDFQSLPNQDALEILANRGLRWDAVGWAEWVYGRLARRSLKDGFPRVGCEAGLHTVFVDPSLRVYPCSIWDAPLGGLAGVRLLLACVAGEWQGLAVEGRDRRAALSWLLHTVRSRAGNGRATAAGDVARAARGVRMSRGRRSFRQVALDAVRAGRLPFLWRASQRAIALRLGRPSSRPVFATLAVTWHCNLRCTMCDFPLRPERAPTREQLLERLDAIAASGALAVGLTGGEPLVHRHLLDVVARARQLGLLVHLNSNGTWALWQRWMDPLLESGLQSINFSLDGARAASHDSQRGADGSFEDVRRVVHELLRRRRGPTPRIGLVMAISRINAGEVVALQDLAARWGVDGAGYLPVHAFVDAEEPWSEAEREALRKAVEEVESRADNSPEYLRGIPAFLAGAATPMRCSAPWTHRAVSADGSVHPCVPLMTLGRAGVPWQRLGTERPRPSATDRDEVCRRCWWNCHRELDLSVGSLRRLETVNSGSSPPSRCSPT